MKTPVTDAAVTEYAKRVRTGESTKDIFPNRMSDCDFSPAQREVIRIARAARKLVVKNGKAIAPPPPKTTEQPKPTAPKPSGIPALPKLGRLLYLQSGRCFFCGEPMTEAEASIEHLHPISRGGTRTEDNEVVCHKSLNHVFGSMGLKDKFAFVLKSAGSFKCPKK